MADDPFVYRLIARDVWEACQAGGVVPWAPVDHEDGFFHLSTRAQCLETARLYYADVDDLLALECAVADLGEALRFEPSRGGALFPHYYGEIDTGLIRAIYRVSRPASGAWDLEALR